MSLYNIPFFEHSKELKNRLSYTIISFLATFSISYIYAEQLIFLLVQPLLKANYLQTLVYTNLLEIVYIYLKVSFLFASVITFPYIIYQIWNFISLGLYYSEKKYYGPRVFYLINFLFIIFAFYNYLLLPIFWKVLLNFQIESENLKLMFLAQITEYLNLFILIFLIFLVITLIPFTHLFVLSKTNLEISQIRKYYYLCTIFIILLISPPDIITQLVLLIPIFCIYETLFFIYLYTKV